MTYSEQEILVLMRVQSEAQSILDLNKLSTGIYRSYRFEIKGVWFKVHNTERSTGVRLHREDRPSGRYEFKDTSRLIVVLMDLVREALDENIIIITHPEDTELFGKIRFVPENRLKDELCYETLTHGENNWFSCFANAKLAVIRILDEIYATKDES